MQSMEATHCPPKIFIVEDSVAIRERLVQALSARASAVVVGQAETASQAIAGILQTQPDCVVLDIHLQASSGITVLREVHEQLPKVVFVVLTNHSGTQYRRMCMAAGASYFFDKSTEVGRVKDVIAGLTAGAANN